jgi:hypothetical protein
MGFNSGFKGLKETGPIMIVYGIKGKCEGPSQATHMETV